MIDMNLTPEWVPFLGQEGWDAVHWSTIGDPQATDATIMARALTEKRVVFTHDLDFGTLLALTHASGPSVPQVRGKMFCRKESARWRSPHCGSMMRLLRQARLWWSKRRTVAFACCHFDSPYVERFVR
jgi:predicted nuclease of predicted toxin-antitoxin system